MDDRHAVHRVTAFEKVAPFTLAVRFEDGTTQVIDFRPVLRGPIFEALTRGGYFDRVHLDEEIGTLTWPNGADFDPAILHDWPRLGPALVALAHGWTNTSRVTQP